MQCGVVDLVFFRHVNTKQKSTMLSNRQLPNTSYYCDTVEFKTFGVLDKSPMFNRILQT